MWINDYIKFEKLYNVIKSTVYSTKTKYCDKYCVFLTDTIDGKNNWCNLFSRMTTNMKRNIDCIEMFGIDDLDNGNRKK